VARRLELGAVRLDPDGLAVVGGQAHASRLRTRRYAVIRNEPGTLAGCSATGTDASGRAAAEPGKGA
jgi:hypothetical protein